MALLFFLSAEVEDIFNIWQQPDIYNWPLCSLPPNGYVSVLNKKLNLRECIGIARGSVESLSKLHQMGIAQKELSLADIYIRSAKVSITRINSQQHP